MNESENEIRAFVGNGQNTTEVYSGSELKELSGELKQRTTPEMNWLMNSVSLQIKRAIIEAINRKSFALTPSLT